MVAFDTIGSNVVLDGTRLDGTRRSVVYMASYLIFSPSREYCSVVTIHLWPLVFLVPKRFSFFRIPHVHETTGVRFHEYAADAHLPLVYNIKSKGGSGNF